MALGVNSSGGSSQVREMMLIDEEASS